LALYDIFSEDTHIQLENNQEVAMTYELNYMQAAQEILDRGWTYVDCPPDCNPRGILDRLPTFLDRRQQHDARQWQATRPSEDEPDVGYKKSTKSDKNHSGRAKDQKEYLMYTPDMARLLYEQHGTRVYANQADVDVLRATDRLHRAGLEISRSVLLALDQLLDPKPAVSLVQAFDFAHMQYAPTATSATRLMRYLIDGGQSHVDRAALTAHWADKGGDLFAVSPFTGEMRVVSPAPGKVLLFPSVKLQIATKGRLLAIQHGSHCQKDIARLAAVTFCQLITDPLVQDQQEAIDAGLEHYQLVA
jgi:hypothetical protein